MSDIERAREALAKATLPSWVERATAEAMIDHSGEPAVRVTLIVRAGNEDAVRDGFALGEISRTILAAFAAVGEERFPYTRYVGASELADDPSEAA